MLQRLRNFAGNDFARPHAKLGTRTLAALLALLAEALIVLAMLTLGWTDQAPKPGPGTRLVSVTIAPDAGNQAEAAKPTPKPKPKPAPAFAAPPVVRPAAPRIIPDAPALAPATPKPPIIIAATRTQMAALDLANLPRAAAPKAAARPAAGPPNLGAPGDSQRIGSAPNGEPLYAAAWYREPYDSELAGYLSTADGPGWALIACRTVSNFRVDDCVGLDEYPTGSQLQRAVLAAAWQFQVRPPRVGGVSKVGEWVRIRIDYGIRAR